MKFGKGDPFEAAELVTKRKMDKTLKYVSDLLLSAYICRQLDYKEYLAPSEMEMVKSFGSTFCKSLGVDAPVSYNIPDAYYVRQSKKTYTWLFKYWVYLNRIYYKNKMATHPDFKLSAILETNNVFV